MTVPQYFYFLFISTINEDRNRYVSWLGVPDPNINLTRKMRKTFQDIGSIYSTPSVPQRLNEKDISGHSKYI
jgi:hypothetical protein